MRIFPTIAFLFVFIFGYSQDPQHTMLQNQSMRYAVGGAGSPKAYSFALTGLKDYPDSIFASTGFTKFLWLMGLRDGIPTQRSVHGYRDEDQQYVAGILSDDGQPVPNSSLYFNRIWNVRKQEIDSLQQLLATGTLTIDAIPEDVLTWPAKGNPHFVDESNAPIVTTDLAPFFDSDEDEIYDPTKGDHPIPLVERPGFLPHQFTFQSFHDVSARDSLSYQPLHMQVGHIAVMTSCEEYPNLMTSVFTRLTFDHKGSEPLDEVRVGIYDDPDIGEYGGDYCGFAQQANAIYAYGSIDYDRFEAVEVPVGFAVVQSTQFITHTLHSFAPAWQPWERFQFDYALTGKDSDGEVAIDPTTGDSTRYWYTGDPLETESWIDRRGGDKSYCGVVSFQLTTDERQTVDFIESNYYGSIDSAGEEIMVDHIERSIDTRQEWEKVQQLDNCSEPEQLEQCSDSCLWPGDIDGDSIVTNQDILLHWAQTEKLEDNLQGIPRRVLSNRWHPVSASDWPQELAGHNAKYYDIEGNGTITTSDLGRLLSNYGKYHSDHPPMAVPPIADSLGISLIVGDSLNFDTLSSFSFGNLTITHGDGINTHPIGGLCFDLQVSQAVAFPVQTELYTIYEAETRNGLQTVLLGTYCYGAEELQLLPTLIHERIITNQAVSDTVLIEFQISNIAAVDTSGHPIAVGVRAAPDLRDYRVVSSASSAFEAEVLIYPNPAEQYFTIAGPDRKQEVRVYDMLGVLLRSYSPVASNIYDLDNLPAGNYVVEIRYSNSTARRELLVKL